MTKRRELWNDKNYHELRKMASRGSKEWFILDDVCVLAAAQGAVCDHTREALESTLAPWLDATKQEKHPATVAIEEAISIGENTSEYRGALRLCITHLTAYGGPALDTIDAIWYEAVGLQDNDYKLADLQAIYDAFRATDNWPTDQEPKLCTATAAWKQASDVNISDDERMSALTRCASNLPYNDAARRIVCALRLDAETSGLPKASGYYPTIFDRCLRHDWPEQEAATDDD